MTHFVSILKEYKYNKIFSFATAEKSILDTTKFESVLQDELNESLSLISSLLFIEHRWVIEWLTSFLNPTTIYSKDLFSFFSYYNKLFIQLDSSLCRKLFSVIIDFENIKLFLSYVILQKSINELSFIPYGYIDIYKLKQLFPSVENLNKYLIYSMYPKTKVSANLQEQNFNFYFDYYLEELIWQSKFFYFTIEPIIFYFFEKLIEIQKLKKIYYTIKNL